MIENEKCECHKCVFLRASQFDRQLLDISLRAEIEDVLSKSEPLPKKPSERISELMGNPNGLKIIDHAFMCDFYHATLKFLDEQFDQANSK